MSWGSKVKVNFWFCTPLQYAWPPECKDKKLEIIALWLIINKCSVNHINKAIPKTSKKVNILLESRLPPRGRRVTVYCHVSHPSELENKFSGGSQSKYQQVAAASRTKISVMVSAISSELKPQFHFYLKNSTYTYKNTR